MKILGFIFFIMTMLVLSLTALAVAGNDNGIAFKWAKIYNSPDVRGVIQYSCTKCHVDAGLTFTDELYTIRDNSMNTATENITVVKGVVDYLPDIELKSSVLYLNKEWTPEDSQMDLTLGVVNTAYSKQG